MPLAGCPADVLDGLRAEAGVDVGNNGEQQRDSFFLYLKERLTGLGGTWQRPSRADVDRYPEFKKRWMEQTSSKVRVSPNEGLPMAIGEVRYIDAAAIEAECRDFADVLNENPHVFVDPFMNAPSPGIVAAAIENQHYDTDLKYLQALREALRIESESPHDNDVPLKDILPAVQQANLGALYLPFAGPRHAHEFRCFENIPLKTGQILVAGVIDPLTNIVEHPEVVSDRIERVAAVLGDPSKVLAATDCGFDTSAGWGRVAPDVVWAKLRSLRDGARIASTRLL